MITCERCGEWVSDHHLCPKANRPRALDRGSECTCAGRPTMEGCPMHHRYHRQSERLAVLEEEALTQRKQLQAARDAEVRAEASGDQMEGDRDFWMERANRLEESLRTARAAVERSGGRFAEPLLAIIDAALIPGSPQAAPTESPPSTEGNDSEPVTL